MGEPTGTLMHQTDASKRRNASHGTAKNPRIRPTNQKAIDVPVLPPVSSTSPNAREASAALLHKTPGSRTRGFRFCAFCRSFDSGAEGIRTPDLRRAKAALSRLSYGPGIKGRVYAPHPGPSTCRLSCMLTCYFAEPPGLLDLLIGTLYLSQPL